MAYRDADTTDDDLGGFKLGRDEARAPAALKSRENSPKAAAGHHNDDGSLKPELTSTAGFAVNFSDMSKHTIITQERLEDDSGRRMSFSMSQMAPQDPEELKLQQQLEALENLRTLIPPRDPPLSEEIQNILRHQRRYGRLVLHDDILDGGGAGASARDDGLPRLASPPRQNSRSVLVTSRRSTMAPQSPLGQSGVTFERRPDGAAPAGYTEKQAEAREKIRTALRSAQGHRERTLELSEARHSVAENRREFMRLIPTITRQQMWIAIVSAHRFVGTIFAQLTLEKAQKTFLTRLIPVLRLKVQLRWRHNESQRLLSSREPPTLEMLKRDAILKLFPDRQLRAAIERMRPFLFRKGEYIMYQGAEGFDLFTLTEGDIELYGENFEIVKDEEGVEQRKRTRFKISQFKSTLGFTFGSIGMISGQPRTVHVVAGTDVVMWQLLRDDFKAAGAGDGNDDEDADRVRKAFLEVTRLHQIKMVDLYGPKACPLNQLRKYRTFARDVSDVALGTIRPFDGDVYRVVHAGEHIARAGMFVEKAMLVMRGVVVFMLPGATLPSEAAVRKSRTQSTARDAELRLETPGTAPVDTLGRELSLADLVPLMVDVPDVKYAPREETLKRIIAANRRKPWLAIPAPCIIGVSNAIFGDAAQLEVAAFSNCDCIRLDARNFNEVAMTDAASLLAIRDQLNLMAGTHMPKMAPSTLFRAIIADQEQGVKDELLGALKPFNPDRDRFRCPGLVVEAGERLTFRGIDGGAPGYLIVSGALDASEYKGKAVPFLWPPLADCYFGGSNHSIAVHRKIRAYRVPQQVIASLLRHIQSATLTAFREALRADFHSRHGREPPEVANAKSRAPAKAPSRARSILDSIGSPDSARSQGGSPTQHHHHHHHRKHRSKSYAESRRAALKMVRELLGERADEAEEKSLAKAVKRTKTIRRTGTMHVGKTATVRMSEGDPATFANVESSGDDSSSSVSSSDTDDSDEALARTVRGSKAAGSGSGNMNSQFARSMHKLMVARVLGKQIDESKSLRRANGAHTSFFREGSEAGDSNPSAPTSPLRTDATLDRPGADSSPSFRVPPSAIRLDTPGRVAAATAGGGGGSLSASMSFAASSPRGHGSLAGSPRITAEAAAQEAERDLKRLLVQAEEAEAARGLRRAAVDPGDFERAHGDLQAHASRALTRASRAEPTPPPAKYSVATPSLAVELSARDARLTSTFSGRPTPSTGTSLKTPKPPVRIVPLTARGNTTVPNGLSPAAASARSVPLPKRGNEFDASRAAPSTNGTTGLSETLRAIPPPGQIPFASEAKRSTNPASMSREERLEALLAPPAPKRAVGLTSAASQAMAREMHKKMARKLDGARQRRHV